MFELPLWQFSTQRAHRSGQWLAEAVATFGLLLTIFGCVARDARRGRLRGRPLHHRGLLVHRLDVVRQSGGDHRTRLSDTFAGIAPAGVGSFIVAQFAGALVAVPLARWLWNEKQIAT